MAVDINSNVPDLPTIVRVMTASGLNWGGTFAQRDRVHFQTQGWVRLPVRPKLQTVKNVKVNTYETDTYLIAIMLVSLALAQSDANWATGKAVYFLKDDARKQWCGYASESKFKAQIESLKAMVVGEMDYANGRMSEIHVTQTDQTGDWAVNDEYILDQNERLQTLKRTINIIPEDTSEKQMFQIKNGKAVKQSSRQTDLRSGEATQKSVDWFHEPPVITNMRGFLFLPLSDKRREVWSRGEACVHVSHP